MHVRFVYRDSMTASISASTRSGRDAGPLGAGGLAGIDGGLDLNIS